MIYEHEVKWTSQPKPDNHSEWGPLGAWMHQFGPAERLPDMRPDRPVIFPQQRDGLVERAKAYVESRGLSWDMAWASNWYPALYNGPRIIIPCQRNDGGKFWQGRLMENLVHKDSALLRWDSPPGPRGDAVVVLGSPGNRSAIFIVEGPMDALGIAGCNFPAVALLGSKPSIMVVEHVGDLVDRYGTVVGIPDRDSLGEWSKIQRMFAAIGVQVRLVEPWSLYKDFAAMPKNEREDFLHLAIEA